MFWFIFKTVAGKLVWGAAIAAVSTTFFHSQGIPIAGHHIQPSPLIPHHASHLFNPLPFEVTR